MPIQAKILFLIVAFSMVVVVVAIPRNFTHGGSAFARGKDDMFYKMLFDSNDRLRRYTKIIFILWLVLGMTAIAIWG